MKAATHRLKYKRAVVDVRKGVDGLRALEAQRDFANEKRLMPDRSSCIADGKPRRTTSKNLDESLKFES
jgi:hypothetical protein